MNVRELEGLLALNATLAGAGDDIPCGIALDEEWHRALLAECGNRELMRLIDAMKRRMHVYEHHDWQESAVETSTRERERIVAALAAGEMETAVAVLEENFRGTMERLTRRLQGTRD